MRGWHGFRGGVGQIIAWVTWIYKIFGVGQKFGDVLKFYEGQDENFCAIE